MKKEECVEVVMGEDSYESIDVHPAAWFGKMFFLLFLLMFFYFFSRGYVDSADRSDLFLLNITMLSINIIMIGILSIIIKIKTTSYYIQKKDGSLTIGEKSGFWLFGKGFSLEINSGTSILIKQSWFGCFFDYGDVYFYINAMPSISLYYVKNPHSFVDKIKQKST